MVVFDNFPSLVTAAAADWAPSVHFPPLALTLLFLTCVLLTFPCPRVAPLPPGLRVVLLRVLA